MVLRIDSLRGSWGCESRAIPAARTTQSDLARLHTAEPGADGSNRGGSSRVEVDRWRSRVLPLATHGQAEVRNAQGYPRLPTRRDAYATHRVRSSAPSLRAVRLRR